MRHREWSTETQTNSLPDVGHPRGLGVGFVEAEHRHIPPLQRPSTYKFNLREGEPFTTFLILGTGYNEPYPVLVSVFLDYRQTRFVLDNQEGLLHYLEIKPGVEMEIPLEVPIETPGWHDLFVAVFREPTYHPLDPQERFPTSLGVNGRRTVVCAGDCTKPPSALPDPLVGEKGEDVRSFSASALPLRPDVDTPPKRRLLLVGHAHPGETFPLEIWARNPDERARDYVVLPLLDFKQFELAGADLLHLQMPAGSELFLPARIKVPREEGVHELQFVYIFDPYQDLDNVTDPFVQSVMRSALIVGDGE